MMRCLREVNVDNNTVGWYQSSVLGQYQVRRTAGRGFRT
jgi:translation initiation factor 3 subunit H